MVQEECLREESRYHYLNCLSDIADGQLDRVREEAKFERGEGRLLRNFKTWRELYANKVQQQEQLAKQLRKQQKAIKENEGPNMEQRQQFLVRAGSQQQQRGSAVCVCRCVVAPERALTLVRDVVRVRCHRRCKACSPSS